MSDTDKRQAIELVRCSIKKSIPAEVDKASVIVALAEVLVSQAELMADDNGMALDVMEYAAERYLENLHKQGEEKQEMSKRITELERALEACLVTLERCADAGLDLVESRR